MRFLVSTGYSAKPQEASRTLVKLIIAHYSVQQLAQNAIHVKTDESLRQIKNRLLLRSCAKSALYIPPDLPSVELPGVKFQDPNPLARQNHTAGFARLWVQDESLRSARKGGAGGR